MLHLGRESSFSDRPLEKSVKIGPPWDVGVLRRVSLSGFTDSGVSDSSATL